MRRSQPGGTHGPKHSRQKEPPLQVPEAGVSLVCSQNSGKASVSGIVIGTRGNPGTSDRNPHTLLVLPSDWKAYIEQVLTQKRSGSWENVFPVVNQH